MQFKMRDLITENENLVRSLAEERRKTKQLEMRQEQDTSSIQDKSGDAKQNLLQELKDLDTSGRFKDPEEEETKRVNKLETIEDEQQSALEKELHYLRKILDNEKTKKHKDRAFCCIRI